MKRVRYFGTMRELHDEDLGKLFKAAGHTAPEHDLTSRIMAQVAVAPMHHATPVAPVIGKRGWMAVAALFALAIVLVCITGGDADGSLLSTWSRTIADRIAQLRVPSGNWTIWLAVGSTCTLFFAWVDRSLSGVKAGR